MTSPHIIVLGNEKGGTGKSTVAMHMATFLLTKGFKVGTIDVDARQGTFTKYFKNRESYIEKHGVSLMLPHHIPVFISQADSVKQREEEERNMFDGALQQLAEVDYIVVDTPGNDTHLSRLAHSHANTIVTPLNDSFVDLDVLGKVNPENARDVRPSHYAEMVWDQKKQRLMRDRVTIDWIVMRNRLSHIFAKNKEEMHKVLQTLAKRIGFRLGHGFSERVVFKELFLKGLTLLDLKDVGIEFTMSHVSARQELRRLMDMLQLPAPQSEKQGEPLAEEHAH